MQSPPSVARPSCPIQRHRIPQAANPYLRSRATIPVSPAFSWASLPMGEAKNLPRLSIVSVEVCSLSDASGASWSLAPYFQSG